MTERGKKRKLNDLYEEGKEPKGRQPMTKRRQVPMDGLIRFLMKEIDQFESLRGIKKRSQKE